MSCNITWGMRAYEGHLGAYEGHLGAYEGHLGEPFGVCPHADNAQRLASTCSHALQKSKHLLACMRLACAPGHAPGMKHSSEQVLAPLHMEQSAHARMLCRLETCEVECLLH